LAEEHDFTFAAKVVRGAYVVAEQLRADEVSGDGNIVSFDKPP